MIRLNTMLTKRGFKNITPDFGAGKANADWVNNTGVAVKRRRVNGKTTVSINKEQYKLPEDNQKLKTYIMENF